MSESAPTERAPGTPESVFVDWIERCRAGAGEPFEQLCGAFPAFQERLRVLRIHHEALELAKLQFDLDGSVAQRLARRFGASIDPQVELEAEGGADLTGALLGRLSGRGAWTGRYRLKGELASGGMGVILRVWDEDLRRHLAMKMVQDKAGAGAESKPSVDPSLLARFLEEAQVTGQLDHPGIVPVHELGLDSRGLAYFTMKLVKGRDLKTILDLVREEREGWSQVKALHVLLKVCEALSYAHDKGVIHRDLKPANIMVGRYGEVYVMDWGLAKVLGRPESRDIRPRAEPDVRTDRRDSASSRARSPLLTLDGEVIGTPAYMAPEQAAGELDAMGPHSDVYAVGALLYHLLSGHMPHVASGEQVGPQEILRRVRAGALAPIEREAQGAPAELVAICAKAMARQPGARYADMAALAADLSAYLEGRVVAAFETGTWAETKKWVQRNRPLAASLAAAIVLLAVGLSASLVFKARADERARELGEANATITQRGLELAGATWIAQESERRALESERLATAHANDVLALSAIQDLEDLEERAEALWPAHPQMLPRLEAWLEDARGLIEGRSGDPAHGLKPKPSLEQHRQKLAELRARALPPTQEEREKDRRASPGFAAWQRERERLQWMRRMLGEEPWPTEVVVEAQLAQESLPVLAQALNGLAWPLVDPDPGKRVRGQEVRALLLSRRGLAAATQVERAALGDTLAWAYAHLGRLEEALAEERRALEAAAEGQLEELRASHALLESMAREWGGAHALEARRAEARELARELDAPTSEVHRRRTYTFADGEDRWWHTQLAQLVEDLEAFAGPGGLYSSDTSAPHTGGVPARAEFARTVRARSIEDQDPRRRWEETIAGVRASPLYGGLELAPQIGLLPLGPDPDSGLFEFAHLQTGEPALRDEHGRLVLDEASGLVLVLLPGGTFAMGASPRPDARNHDPQALPHEGPVHEVTLRPFFLAKHELTQGQWLRMSGTNPSAYQPPNALAPTLLHPVEQVNWFDCMTLAARLGLHLPSEAQWEYAARGGTSTAWSSGQERESLRGRVNIADQTAKQRARATWAAIQDWPDLEDGGVVHTPVGTYLPNPFGLHDMGGNLWEWCADGYVANYYLSSPRVEPLAPTAGNDYVVARGGSFSNAAANARSAARGINTPQARGDALGLRPARALDP